MCRTVLWCPMLWRGAALAGSCLGLLGGPAWQSAASDGPHETSNGAANSLDCECENTCALHWPRKGIDARVANLDATNVGQNAPNETSKSVAGRVPTSIDKNHDTTKLSTVGRGRNQSILSETITMFCQLASPFQALIPVRTGRLIKKEAEARTTVEGVSFVLHF